MKKLAFALMLIVATGCASKSRQPPTATVPNAPRPATEPAPPPATTTPGQVSAPWDTAGTAAARAARRNHVYPQGANALGQKLVDSLPDPIPLARTSEGPKPSAPPLNDRACWEVQVLVTTNKDRAEREARQITKVLDLAAWVVDDGAMHRVRAGGCLTADGAAELANRLRQEGYPEAFRTMRMP